MIIEEKFSQFFLEFILLSHFTLVSSVIKPLYSAGGVCSVINVYIR